MKALDWLVSSRKTQCCVNCIYMKTRPSAHCRHNQYGARARANFPECYQPSELRFIELIFHSSIPWNNVWLVGWDDIFVITLYCIGVSTLRVGVTDSVECCSTIWYSWPSKCLFLLSHWDCCPSTIMIGQELHQGNIKFSQSLPDIWGWSKWD